MKEIPVGDYIKVLPRDDCEECVFRPRGIQVCQFHKCLSSTRKDGIDVHYVHIPKEEIAKYPTPCPEDSGRFKYGEKVLVRKKGDQKELRRYYSHYDEEQQMHHCFRFGQSPWTSNGGTSAWDYCRKPEDSMRELYQRAITLAIKHTPAHHHDYQELLKILQYVDDMMPED